LELIDSIPKPESAPATSSPPKVTEVMFLESISLISIRKIPFAVSNAVLKGAQESGETSKKSKKTKFQYVFEKFS